MVAHAGRRHFLTRGAKTTAAGGHYYGLLGETVPIYGEDFASGNSEFARVHGKLKRMRTWMPEDNSYRYTQAGKAYYATPRSTFVTHVPIRIVGHRDGKRTGEQYERQGMRPVTDVPGVAEAMQSPPDVREARVKALVMAHLGDSLGGQSNEQWFPGEGQWTISELRTDAELVTEALLERPLGAAPLSLGWLKWSTHIIPEAWIDDGRCVARQLAAVLGKSIETIEGELTQPTSNAVLEYCKAKGHTCHVLSNNRVIARYTSPYNRKAIAFDVYGQHCYFYSQAAKRAISQLPVHQLEAVPSWRLEKRCPPPSDFKLVWWEGEYEPGEYYCYADNLAQVRRDFLESGRSPKVHLASASCIRKLTYNLSSFDKAQGVITVTSLPADFERIQEWCARLGCPYRGEGLPGISQRVLLHLMKQPRRSLTPAQKQSIVDRQVGRCKECAEEAQLEFDHIWEVSASPLPHATDNFQGLCTTCHNRKSRQRQVAPPNPLMSYFSPSLHDQYVVSEKPKAFIWHGKGSSGVHVDVRRCRFNALRELDQIPIFGPLDSVQKCEQQLYDLMYIDKPVTWCPAKLLRLLPYQGASWYTRRTVQHLLHYGKIRWEHCLWGVNASAKVPNLLREPLDKMEAAWGSSPLAKLSVNAMLGLWCKQPCTYTCRSEAHGPHSRVTFQYAKGEVVDYISKTEIRGGGTMRPIHDAVLQSEHCRLAEAIFIVTRLGTPMHAISEAQTDSILFQPPAKRRKLIQETLCDLEYKDLSTLRLRYEPPIFGRSGLPPSNSDTKVFRVGEQMAKLTCTELPLRCCTPPIKRDWNRVDEAGAVEAVKRGESLCIQGMPGTGKSHFLKQLLPHLEGEVALTGPTHVSARLIGGVTLQHFSLKRIASGSFTRGWLIVDEVSMLSCAMWADICKLVRSDVRLILVGDFSQFLPVHNLWCGCEVPSAVDSDMLRDLAPNLLVLEENRRSDAEVFDFCKCMLTLSLEDAVAAARELFPLSREEPQYHLCLSHKRRIVINARVNSRHPAGAVFCKAGPPTKSANVSQDMWIYNGLQLLACCAKRGKLFNGARLVVEEIDEKVRLRLGDEVVEMSLEAVGRDLRLCHAITYHAAQGQTMAGRVRLHDLDHGRFTLRHLFVGCSRVTDASLLEVA